jgi:hypothetical protein
MKQINLPVIAISTGLSGALTQLRKSKRSALLSESEGEYHLFTAGNIAAGRSKGVKTLSGLTSNAKLKAKTARSPLAGRSKRPPLVDARRLAAGVAKAGAKKVLPLAVPYVLGLVAGKSALLGIRNVNMALKFVSSPKDLYCDGPRHHDDFPPPDVSEGDPCPHRDGHKIISAR